MKFTRDKRSAWEQAKSGLKIAGAVVASITTIGLFVKGYDLLIRPENRLDIAVALVMLGSTTIFSLATMYYWRLWFPLIPGYLGLRSLLGFYFGWFMSDISGLWAVTFPLLTVVMALLTVRFSKKGSRMSMSDRTVLFAAFLCLLLAIANLFSSGLTKAPVLLVAAGDGVLSLSWLHRKHFRRSGTLNNPEVILPKGETTLS